MKSAHFYQYCCIFTFSWVGFLALSRVFLTACSVALILLHHSLLLFHPLLVCKSVHVWRCLSLCVCTCGRVYVTVAVLVKLLTTSLFSVLCHNYYDDYQSYLNVCVCGGGLALAHEALPLQSQSAPSCCFHSSSKSQHSQPRSLPCFILLVLAHSDSHPNCISFFFFFVLHAIWMSGQDWTHFGTPFTFTLAEVISVLEIKTKPNDD